MSDLQGPFAPELTHMRETGRGTQYEVVEWRCPKCRGMRSTLYIDGEWCHGESYHVRWSAGEEVQQCGACWQAEIDAMPHNRPALSVPVPPLAAADRVPAAQTASTNKG